MMPQKLGAYLAVAALCCSLTSCGQGQKEISFGSVHFVHSGATITIDPCPPPDDIDFLLPDGRNIHLASINKKQAIALFGDKPLLEGKVDRGATTYEEFGVEHVCIFVFKNGSLARIYASGGVKVINTSTQKSLTLPAKESEMREVFGRPTAVRYPKGQQP